MKTIAILGSTGSIGRNALEVVRSHPGQFKITSLAAGDNWELLCEQAKEFLPELVCIFNPSHYQEVKKGLSPLKSIRVSTGMEGLCEAVSTPCERVLLAVMGSIGIQPALLALRQNKILCLANKESLVAAGEMVLETLKKGEGKIIPVDSEHSAIFQCLTNHPLNEIKRIILTASGGPFRTFPLKKLHQVTVEQALNHPTWSMGGKITIDSATLMNKGLELIEAYYLFGQKGELLEVVVHPQSIIHSLVEFIDHSTLAQLSHPDMKIPIQYALTYPRRLPQSSSQPLDLPGLKTMTFEPPDLKRFPCLGLARNALIKGGNWPCALNAANEVAVEKFLKGEGRFMEIPQTIEQVLEKIPFIPCPSLEDIFHTDQEARKLAGLQRVKDESY